MESSSKGSILVTLDTDVATEEQAERLGDDAAHALFNLTDSEGFDLELIQVVDITHGYLTTVYYSEAVPNG